MFISFLVFSSNHRDNRLRKHLQVRYDSRSGAFDWDYNMKLLERGANIIYSPDYAKWRESGVAFVVREGTYDVPNRTLASGLLVKTVSDLGIYPFYYMVELNEVSIHLVISQMERLMKGVLTCYVLRDVLWKWVCFLQGILWHGPIFVKEILGSGSYFTKTAKIVKSAILRLKNP